MDNSFELGGRKFKISKMDAFKQFHVARRLGPILADILPAMKGAKNLTTEAQVAALPDDKKWDVLAGIAEPLMKGFSKLDDAESEFVLHTLLSAVEIYQTPHGNWAKISNGTILLMQDLELPMLLQIAGRAFMFNLSGFFGALPQK